MERVAAVILLFIVFRCCECLLLTDEDCIDSFSCYPEGGNQLGYFKNVMNPTECQQKCKQELNCTFFTYYDDSHATVLNSTCFTFSECEIKNRGCTGCFSGPPTCSSCPTPFNNGGVWFCQKNEAIEESRENQKCFYTCGNELKLKTTCQAGSFDVVEEKIVCPCYNKPEGSNVTCNNGELSEEHDYPTETKCTKTCSKDEIHETVCENGMWTTDFSRVSCSSSTGHSLYLIIGLAVVGGSVLISAGVVVYLLGFKAYAKTEMKPSRSRNRSFSTIDAYGEPNKNESTRYIEKIPKVLELSQADEPDDRGHWNGVQEPTTAHHYHFERLPPRPQQPRSKHQEEGSHPPPRLYQQSRHLYQGRGYRPRDTEQPLSRGTSLSELQI